MLIALDAAARIRFGDVRVGGFVDASASPSNAPETHARVFTTADVALYRDDQVVVFVGAGAGPSLVVQGSSSAVGAALIATLDVALPLRKRLALDFIVRAGAELPLTVAVDHPISIGQFAIGLTWDL